MFLWFISLAVLGVHSVFRDTALDHRLIAVGALLPDVVDGIVRRGSGPLHSVAGAVTLLIATMIATIGRRQLRKRLLAIPIGVFAHLVLDGAWANTDAFWWPFTGTGFAGRLPVVQRGLGVDALLETVGLFALVYGYKRFGLARPARRRAFFRDGWLESTPRGQR